jgi:predicted O-methyltransferase YrrM
VPIWAKQFKEAVTLRAKAERLRRRSDKHHEWDRMAAEVIDDPRFRAIQNRTEIVSLLRLVQRLKPRRLLEIGTANGGTLFLLSRAAAADARLLSLDIGHTLAQRHVYPRFARRGQHITCLTGDSHSRQIRSRIVDWLGGRPLDFLFIDGDHSLDGVSKDFSMYAPLLRPGGLVAFHDIVPDFKTRFGIVTLADVGQVPSFWRDLKGRFKECFEFIDEPNQDGRGIGVLSWP